MAAGAQSVLDAARGVLSEYVSRMTAEGILRGAMRRAERSEEAVERLGVDEALLTEISQGLRVFLGSDAQKAACLVRLRALRGSAGHGAAPEDVVVIIRDETGIVDARTHARSIARDLGFDRTDQAKIATSVSELARNIHSYARRGQVRLSPVTSPRRGLRIVVEDDGPGIQNVAEILAGTYRSRTGLGLGIRGCKKLMDDFSIETGPGRGTRICLHKYR